MFRFWAPVIGVFVLLVSLDTMPAVWAQTAIDVPTHPPVEIPAALTMIPYLGDLLLQVQKWMPVIFQVVGAFAMIAAMAANETDDKVVNYILKAINFLGFNFGTAKNDPTIGVSKEAADRRLDMRWLAAGLSFCSLWSVWHFTLFERPDRQRRSAIPSR